MAIADFIGDLVRDVVRDGFVEGLTRVFGKGKPESVDPERKKILAKRRLDRRNRRKK
ncbi:MAG: hypothetical protein J0H88_16990 [Sphingomonadales bacterium]|nr:hypothetical protein [Sphingomonadales bacterium]